MSTPTGPRPPSSEDERVITIVVLAVAAMAAAGSAGLLLTRGVTWLITHHVLVAPGQALVSLPGTGAGLDAPRLMIATAAIAAALAMTASKAAWTWRTRTAHGGAR